MTAKASISMTVSGGQEGANSFGGGPFWNGLISFASALGSGVAGKQIDTLYMAERTVAASSSDDIDLAGVLTDALGASIVAAELVGIVVVNEPKDPAAARNQSTLTIGGATNPVPGFSAAIVPIEPGGVFAAFSPGTAGIATVTAATGDKIRVANGAGGTAKYQIAILARSA
ncbi:hypothetical protein FJ973_05980 [Mesorhizobium sp. B2-1-3]|uniref:hypothetical protein n=1 Tax=Mesorhizobium sp. B2-1-3 TaxID=2589972 RepID=UPI0011285DEB|nr:hypothetical protein [Mesorhizobium sp. B2-1-3]TPN16239.1 hypothetical protein FJ973_05980 [Mesorhizobium sp. B2-1-3]